MPSIVYVHVTSYSFENEAGGHVGGVKSVSVTKMNSRVTASGSETPIDLFEYAEKLVGDVKKRYEEKISEIGVDPLRVPESKFSSEYLPAPVVESIWIFYHIIPEMRTHIIKMFKGWNTRFFSNNYQCIIQDFVKS